MTTVQAEKIARRKLSLLELAQELGNVSKACRIAGYSRQQFYEIRRNFQMYGAEGLLDRMPGAKRAAPEPGGLGSGGGDPGPRAGAPDARGAAGGGRTHAEGRSGKLGRGQRGVDPPRRPEEASRAAPAAGEDGP